jgi:hypothetical protein
MATLNLTMLPRGYEIGLDWIAVAYIVSLMASLNDVFDMTTAERFAFALVEWLKDCKGFENSLRRSYAASQFVQFPESYSVGTAH